MNYGREAEAMRDRCYFLGLNYAKLCFQDVYLK